MWILLAALEALKLSQRFCYVPRNLNQPIIVAGLMILLRWEDSLNKFAICVAYMYGKILTNYRTTYQKLLIKVNFCFAPI